MALPLLDKSLSAGDFMTKRTENFFKLMLALSMLALTVGCGSSKTVSDDGSVDLGSSVPGVPENKPVASCSADTSTSDLHAKAMTMVNAYGQVDANQMRFKLSSLPAGFLTDEWDLQVRQWTEDGSGNSVLSGPLSFYFERKVSYGYETVSSSQFNILNMDEIRQMAAAVSGPTTDSAIRDYFNFRIPTGSSNYHVLRLTMRLKNNGAIQREIDILMPSFYAKPSDYQAYRPSLYFLHPMKSRAGQSWTDAQWKGFTDAFCF